MGLILKLGAAALAAALCHAAAAETIRLATWDPALTRDGPGLLLRDMARKDAQIDAALAVLTEARADVILLTGLDWDHDGQAPDALIARLAAAGLDYPHHFAPRPNSGMATGLDLNGDGRFGTPDDAQGYGRFSGQNGMAILSRLPLGPAQDFSATLWRDLPGNLLDAPPEVAAIQRLSSTGHWDVAVQTTSGPLHLLAWSGSPPVFGGKTDRNARRNHDETAFWTAYLDSALPFSPPDAPFVIIGKANLDPEDGDGRHQAIRALLNDPRLQDPRPRSTGGPLTGLPGKGDPALDTGHWPGRDLALRVSYILPAAGLSIHDSGVLWPAEGVLADTVVTASPHRLVWVDVEMR
ncbi:endonuclease/exonuclease/phosphatase family protein [Paracoccus sp. (in: a-proteobacteria)]|uniref:endonuclease/exonuclease/phosphatase family protein n=1 Tax=Paracoccus sp. TaxID=267 RepID=UPI0034CE519C